jgi:hypothetical protein
MNSRKFQVTVEKLPEHSFFFVDFSPLGALLPVKSSPHLR